MQYVVQFSFSCHPNSWNQFEVRYNEINKSLLSTVKKQQKRHGLKTLLRELSDDEHDANSTITPSSSDDPEKPWKRDYNSYIDTVHDVLEGMSAVQWWGVCTFSSRHFTVAHISISTIARDTGQSGHLLHETTFPSWLRWCQVSGRSRKVESLSVNGETDLRETLLRHYSA
jgi:hypothetical protein